MGPVQAREVLGSEGLCPWFNSLDAVWKFFLHSLQAVLAPHCCAGFPLVVGSRGRSPASVLMLLIAVASLVAEPWLQDVQASVAAARGLSYWGSWAELPRGMWNVSRPGMEPVSPALPRQILNHGTTGETLP